MIYSFLYERAPYTYIKNFKVGPLLNFKSQDDCIKHILFMTFKEFIWGRQWSMNHSVDTAAPEQDRLLCFFLLAAMAPPVGNNYKTQREEIKGQREECSRESGGRLMKLVFRCSSICIAKINEFSSACEE